MVAILEMTFSNAYSWLKIIVFWLKFYWMLFCIVQSIMSLYWFVNSLAPGRSECDSKNGIFNLDLLIGIFRSSHDNALRWMPPDLTYDKSTLVQVMAWCRQAKSHYLSQCWLSPLSPYGVARPQWVSGTGNKPLAESLTHWGRATHICIGKLIIIGSDNGL